jgi:hypothetical protein
MIEGCCRVVALKMDYPKKIVDRVCTEVIFEIVLTDLLRFFDAFGLQIDGRQQKNGALNIGGEFWAELPENTVGFVLEEEIVEHGDGSFCVGAYFGVCMGQFEFSIERRFEAVILFIVSYGFRVVLLY